VSAGTATIAQPLITPKSNPTAIPSFRPRLFDRFDALAIVSAVFPDLKFISIGNEFQVNGSADWRIWVNSRAEGRFTQTKDTELAAIIANEAPRLTGEEQRSYPWGSFLAVLQQSNGRLQVTQKSYLFPASISPLSLDVRIDSVADFDHDNQDELVVLAVASRMGSSSTAAFLYQWNEQSFSTLWQATVGEDNTGAINQPAYFASTPDLRVLDLDGDGIDEIVVNSTRIDYARDDQGLADLDHEMARRSERRVYHWDGNTFVPFVELSTPLPPLPSPSPQGA
jgi:hypothetical protein